MLLPAWGIPVWTLGATIFYAKLFFYMDGHIGDEKEDIKASLSKQSFTRAFHCRALVTRVHTRNCSYFLRTFQA